MQGENQVIYRKVEEYEERSRGGGGSAIPIPKQRHTKHSGGIMWPTLAFPRKSKSLSNTNLNLLDQENVCALSLYLTQQI